MFAIQQKVQVNLSTVVDDILVNNILASNFKRPYIVRYALVADAAGLILDLKVGLNFVATGIQPSIQNRFPIDPDDFLGQFGVLPGDRILLAARETSGVNRQLFFCFKFTPVGGR